MGGLTFRCLALHLPQLVFHFIFILKRSIKECAKDGESFYKTHFGEVVEENELYHEYLIKFINIIFTI